MIKSTFPKILFLEITPHHKDATGITLSNLFSGWPKENLYMVVSSEMSMLAKDSGYLNIYEISSKEYKHRFPLNLIKGVYLLIKRFGLKKFQTETTNIYIESAEKSIIQNNNTRSLNKFVSQIFNSFLQQNGLQHYLYRCVLSDDLCKWIENSNPDYIYTLLSTRHSILFALEVYNKFKKPIVVHIMDDWPSTIAKNGMFSSYLSKKIDSEFMELLNHCYKKFAISKKMADEYKLRYGGEWPYFHNPIDLSFWGKNIKNSYSANSPFEILYSGRIGSGVNNTLELIAESIDELVLNENLDIVLKIQSNDKPEWIAKYKSIQFSHYVKYEELPALFSKVDVLLIPFDFDGEGLEFIKYSMPTKVSEYMISGTPILVVSPDSTALYQYATEYKWGFVISENNKDAIKSGIKELFSNQKKREELGKIAKQVAEARHNIVKITEEFANQFD